MERWSICNKLFINFKGYYLKHIPLMFIFLSVVFIVFIGIFSLTWYTFFDPFVCYRPGNRYRFLNIANGKQSYSLRNPLLYVGTKFAVRPLDVKSLFYLEIEEALESKNKKK
jgi:hypothetical protein